MRINDLKLQNFRSFKKKHLEFPAARTVIVGVNASGKSNLLEAIYCLATGRSLRTSRESELIQEGASFARVEGQIEDLDGEKTDLLLQVIKSETGGAQKRFTVNGVGRTLLNFSGHLPAVVFEPEDIQLILGTPDLRRLYLNNVLSMVSKNYHRAVLAFDKIRRNRNRVLEGIREGELRLSDLEFWDEKILEAAPVISQSRFEFFEFLSSNAPGLTFPYRQSELTLSRMTEYRDREIASATTLIGPHRDDFSFEAKAEKSRTRNLAIFGSRGEQRLAVFSLKLLEIEFLKMKLEVIPVLLLDDIFSELDLRHRQEIVGQLGLGQVILTTTEKDFIRESPLSDGEVLFLD